MTLAPTSLHPRRRLWAGPVFVVALALATIVLALVFRNDVVVGGSSTSPTVQGSGVAATEVRTTAPFDRVELRGSNTVSIHVGAARSVVVHADDNLLRHITTSVAGRLLVVGNTPGGISPKSPLRVDVTVPVLAAVDLSGSGVVLAEGVSTSALEVRLSGSGVIHAAGRATRLHVELTGSGDAQLEQVIAADVHATVAGSGRILVHPTTSLHASVPGSGSITYAGKPRHVTTDITGSGAVAHA